MSRSLKKRAMKRRPAKPKEVDWKNVVLDLKAIRYELVRVAEGAASLGRNATLTMQWADSIHAQLIERGLIDEPAEVAKTLRESIRKYLRGQGFGDMLKPGFLD